MRPASFPESLEYDMTYAASGVVGQRERDSGHTEAFGGACGGAVKTQAGGRTRPAFDLQQCPNQGKRQGSESVHGSRVLAKISGED